MPKRPRGTIALRNGAYRIRYSLGRDPVTGKRKFGTATVRGTRKAAEKELTRLIRTVDTGEHVDPSRMTVSEWLRLWLAGTQVSPKTYESYNEIIRCYLAPSLGSIALQRLTPTDIQQASSSWLRQDGQPLSARSRRYIHVVLKSALARAVEQQALARNSAAAVRAPKAVRRQLATLTVEQSRELLARLRHMHIYWPVMLALATGMRRGEILALRWRNVDLDRGAVRVVESLEETKAGLRFKPPKTGKGRAVALPRFAVEELRQHRKEQAESLLAMGIRQSGDTLVCAREDGEPKLPGSVTGEFARVVRRLGLPVVRFHDLRHSHATALLADGIHPKIAQERLGHATISTTMDLYSHVTDTMQADAAARLDAALRKR
jgi:integrase